MAILGTAGLIATGCGGNQANPLPSPAPPPANSWYHLQDPDRDSADVTEVCNNGNGELVVLSWSIAQGTEVSTARLLKPCSAPSRIVKQSGWVTATDPDRNSADVTEIQDAAGNNFMVALSWKIAQGTASAARALPNPGDVSTPVIGNNWQTLTDPDRDSADITTVTDANGNQGMIALTWQIAQGTGVALS